MGMSNSDLAEKYFDDPFGTPRKASNTFFEDGVLYSYGYHFPIAISLKIGSNYFLFNGDTYSVTTARHQSIARSFVDESRRIIVPFSALTEAVGNFRWSRLKLCEFLMDNLEIIDYESDKYVKRKVKDPKTGEMVERIIHVLGASVFRVSEDFYISGIDESARGGNAYFLTKLPERVYSVGEAYEAIMPEGIRGLSEDQYFRQGEWFFTEAKGIKASKDAIQKQFELQSRGDRFHRNKHEATEGFMLDGQAYVRGCIRHIEHKMISLPDKKAWYAAYEAPGAGPNGEVLSWSAGGNVD